MLIKGKRRGLSAEQKAELWNRWKAGQSLNEIGRALGKDHVVVHFVLARHGGIAPPARRRSSFRVWFRGAGRLRARALNYSGQRQKLGTDTQMSLFRRFQVDLESNLILFNHEADHTPVPSKVLGVPHGEGI